MKKRAIKPTALRMMRRVGEPINEVWSNDLYECMVRYLNMREGRRGPVHLSIKRLDRAATRDWRHMQSIKNEVLGREREAVELYPAESRLVDQANQTHLWAFDEGVTVPLGYRERVVATQEESRATATRMGFDAGKARQRDWQPGLSTGPSAKAMKAEDCENPGHIDLRAERWYLARRHKGGASLLVDNPRSGFDCYDDAAHAIRAYTTRGTHMAGVFVVQASG